MEHIDIVENFYGVYLLKSINPKYKGRVYIGFTVDPNRRIKQHNRGKQFGGAWRTSKKGPWEMILTVHGFPSEVSALRFEWAWQHPKKSRRLKNIIINKKSSETSLDYSIKIMFTMLCTPPWNRLPLTVRWLSADAVVDAPPNAVPPAHMPVVYGSVISKKISDRQKSGATEGHQQKFLISCQICGHHIREEDLLTCLSYSCTGSWHLLCLADKFIEDEHLFQVTKKQDDKEVKHVIPVEGACPQCNLFVLWGDLIKKKKGCYKGITECDETSISNKIN